MRWNTFNLFCWNKYTYVDIYDICWHGWYMLTYKCVEIHTLHTVDIRWNVYTYVDICWHCWNMFTYVYFEIHTLHKVDCRWNIYTYQELLQTGVISTYVNVCWQLCFISTYMSYPLGLKYCWNMVEIIQSIYTVCQRIWLISTYFND